MTATMHVAVGEPTTQHHAAIETIIESVATLADRSDFESLEKLFSPEVRVDYSSLSGEPAALKSNSALMTEWAGVLPGFDRTRHSISNIAVSLEGRTASASADVAASHWVGELFWHVDGRYDYRFTLEDEQWLITSMTFTLTDERGTREVFGPAIDAAKTRPPAYVLRQQTRTAVLDFLEGLERKDMDRVNSVWAEDAVQDMPFSPEGFPKRVTGRDALIAHYAAWPEVSGEARFTDGIVFHSMLDPQTIFVEFTGSVEILTTGRHYAQTYGGLFHVVDGKIQLFREYYDPIVFSEAFGIEKSPRDEP